jgi:hypothetical protein
MAGVDDQDLVTRLLVQVQQALSSTTESDEKRRRALKRFFMEPTGTEEENYPTITSADVNSMVTSVLAQYSISYSTDMSVEFEAESAEDEIRAQAESRVISKILEENHGNDEIMMAAQNDLLGGPGVVKVWWEDDINSFFVRHEGIEHADLPVIAQQEPGVDRRLVSYDPEKGIARVEVTETTRRLRVACVTPERFFIDPDHLEHSFASCVLAGEIHYKTRDELSRMGVEWALVKELRSVNQSDQEYYRRQWQSTGSIAALQMQSDVIRVFEVYARYTRDDNDDRTYLYKNFIAEGCDEFLLDPELVSRMPYATGTSFPVAGQFRGQSLAEKTIPVEDGKTELLRQLLGNVRNCSYGRLGIVSNAADAADVLNPKPGGIIRLKNPDALVPIPVLDVGPSIQIGFDALDKQRAERGGASLDLGSAPLQVASDSAHATERFYSAQETLSSYMGRNYSNIYRDVYILLHQELRSGAGGPISLKVAEQWTQEDPTQWGERKWCTVTVAPSFGERVHMSNALSQCLQWDMALLQGGMQDTLVTLPGMHKKLCDWLRLNLIPNPEIYYIDPSSQQAQAAAQAKSQGAQMAQKQQTDLLMGIEQLKAQVEKYKTDNKTAFDYFNTTMTVGAKVAENETQGSVNVIRAVADAEIARKSLSAGSEGSGGKGQNGSSQRRGGKAKGGGRTGGANGATEGN